MSEIFTLPQAVVIQPSGTPYANAKAYFYRTATLTAQTVYQDSACTVAHAQPVLADDGGYFPVIYKNPDALYDYRVVVRSASDVLLEDNSDIPRSSFTLTTSIIEATFTSDLVAQLLVSLERTQAEIDAEVTPTDYSYPPGDVRRYGATGDGTTDDTAAIQDAINVVFEAGGGIVFLPAGTFKITSSLTYTAINGSDSLIIRGSGSNVNGTVISNVTNDVPAFYFDGDITEEAKRIDRVVLEDFRIIHEGDTQYAIEAREAPYMFISRLAIDCNEAGKGGIFFGSTTVIPDSDNFLSAVRDTDIRDYVTHGIRVNSKGHTFQFDNCKVGGSVDDSIAGYFNTEAVHVNGGQWGTGGTDTGGWGIKFFNLGAGDIEGGSVRNLKLEGIRTNYTGIEIDGTTNAFTGILIENVGANLTGDPGPPPTGNGGTLVKFGHAKWCKFVHQAIRSPTGGGTLCEWGANSVGCELVCDYNAATAPITCDAAATRASKTVTGEIARSQVPNITTAATLRVVLRDGIDELPGWNPVYKTAWNFWCVTLADDEASSFTTPTTRCWVEVFSDNAVTFAGSAFVRTDASAAGYRMSEVTGSDFEVTASAGALAGTSGTDTKVTIRGNTNGKLYLENRAGGSRDYTVLFRPTGFGI